MTRRCSVNNTLFPTKAIYEEEGPAQNNIESAAAKSHRLSDFLKTAMLLINLTVVLAQRDK